MTTNRIRRLLNASWLVFATVSITAAVLVTAARIVLPHLAAHPESLIRWVSDVAGVALTVESVRANWNGALPELELSGIDIRYAQDAPPLRLEHAGIRVRPLVSLFRFELVPSTLVLDGIRLIVERREDGRLRLVGAATPETEQSEAGMALARWLLDRDDVRIKAARITWVDRLHDTSPLMVRDADLRIRKLGSSHAIRIRLHPSSAPGAEAQLLAEIEGDPLSQDWSGRMRLTGNGLPLAEILRGIGFAGARWRGALTLAIDSDWRQGALRTARGEFSGEHLDLGADLLLATARGAIAITRSVDERLTLSLRKLVLVRDDRTLPTTALDLVWQHDGSELRYLVGQVDSVRLREIVPALRDRPELPEAARAALAADVSEGELHQLRFGYFGNAPGPPDFHIGAQLRGVALQPAGFPLMTGLSGVIEANRGGGELALRAPSILLHGGSGGLLDDVALSATEGSLHWRRGANDWLVTLDTLRAETADTVIDAAGALRVPDAGSTEIDLQIAFGGGDVTVLRRLLPTGLLSERTESWIRRALVDGRLIEGGVVLRGPLDALPFDHQEGRVEARIRATDLTLDFSPRWPPLEQAAIDLAIDGRRLTAVATSGRVLGAEVLHADVGIADLLTSERLLTVHGQARGTTGRAINVIRASPLREGKVARIADLNLTGNVDLDLDLSLPLRPGSHAAVRGAVRLSDAGMRATAPAISLTALHGTIEFTRESWRGDEIAAVYEGRPVIVSANSELADPRYAMEFTMRGEGDAQFVRDQLARYVGPAYQRLARAGRLDALQGSAAWQAHLLLPHTMADQAPVPPELNIDSDLRGLAIDLPWPLHKDAAADQALHIAVRLPLGDGKRIVQARYGTDLRAEFEAHDDAPHGSRIQRAAILLGSGSAPFSDRRALLIHGHGDRISLDDWWALLGPDDVATETPQVPEPSLPLDLDLTVGQLTILGQTYADMKLSGGGTDYGWQVAVASEDFQGRVGMTRNPVVMSAALERLRVMPRDAQTGTRVDPRRLPAFAITCDDFRFGDLELGAAKLSAHPDEQGLVIDTLQLHRPEFAVTASGHWTISGAEHRSRVEVAVLGDDLARLLAAFGYQTGAIEAATSRIDLAADWLGSPAEFGLARLHGTLRLAVDKGRLLDLEPGGGRLFGLLSINNLGRRLLLDFGDLFGKGYSFNSMSGTFQLEDGNAFTNDFAVLGPSARVEVAGRVGLVATDYDQRVTVTPEFSSTLPLAGALFGPAGIGVGAAVYLGEKIFRSIPEKFDSLLKREYTLTGTWQEPMLERMQYAQSDR